MDALITNVARALAVGNPLGALNRVALREDAPRLRFEASRWRSSAILFAQGRTEATLPTPENQEHPARPARRHFSTGQYKERLGAHRLCNSPAETP
jgi:hypothetical protein